MEGAAGLDDLPVLSEIGVGADGAAQVVGLASAHGPRRVEVMAVRVADAVAAHREGRLRDDDPGEGVGDADVVRLVEKGQEPVVLAGLLPVPVLDDGEDLDLLLDDAVVRLGHPPAREGGGRVPAGEELVAQIGDGANLAAGHRVHATTDPGTVMGTALPEGGQPRGARTEGAATRRPRRGASRSPTPGADAGRRRARHARPVPAAASRPHPDAPG